MKRNEWWSVDSPRFASLWHLYSSGSFRLDFEWIMSIEMNLILSLYTIQENLRALIDSISRKEFNSCLLFVQFWIFFGFHWIGWHLIKISRFSLLHSSVWILSHSSVWWTFQRFHRGRKSIQFNIISHHRKNRHSLEIAQWHQQKHCSRFIYCKLQWVQ